MSKKTKFYAVKSGRIPGVYETWDECRNNVDGYFGAIYKSFPTRKEAMEFVLGDAKAPHDKVFSDKKTEAIAYVDGSYNSATGEYSYGAVIFFEGKEYQFSEKFKNPEMAAMRNVAGEIEGACKAMAFCLDNSIESLELYYDYEGIRAWPTGLWKANKKGTIAYRDYYNSIKERLKINFVKVMAHTGVTYNELADKLAKEALGL